MPRRICVLLTAVVLGAGCGKAPENKPSPGPPKKQVYAPEGPAAADHVVVSVPGI